MQENCLRGFDDGRERTVSSTETVKERKVKKRVLGKANPDPDLSDDECEVEWKRVKRKGRYLVTS